MSETAQEKAHRINAVCCVVYCARVIYLTGGKRNNYFDKWSRVEMKNEIKYKQYLSKQQHQQRERKHHSKREEVK